MERENEAYVDYLSHELKSLIGLTVEGIKLVEGDCYILFKGGGSSKLLRIWAPEYSDEAVDLTLVDFEGVDDPILA